MNKANPYELLIYLNPFLLLFVRIIYDLIPVTEIYKLVVLWIIVIAWVIAFSCYGKKFSRKYPEHTIEKSILSFSLFLYAFILLHGKKYLDQQSFSAVASFFLQVLSITPLFILTVFLLKRIKHSN